MVKKINLTVDPMWQLLRRVTFPASIGSLFQTFYNLVDTFFAGKISPDALSALAKSFPIYFIIIAIGVGVGAGTNTLIGNSIGEKKEKVASLYVAQSIIFAIVISLLVTFIGINSAEIKDHQRNGNFLEVTVDFVSEIISCVKDKNLKIISGDPEKVKKVYDTWRFSRNLNSNDPNWILVETNI